MNQDNHVNMDGLILCKKLCADKSYIFRWSRQDNVYRSDRLFVVLTWIKEKILFIQQWKPVSRDEYKNFTGQEFPAERNTK